MRSTTSAASAGGGGGAYVAPAHRREDGTDGAIRKIPKEEWTKLRVSNLAPDTTQQDLTELFQPFGNVRDCKIPRDYRTNEPKGFAYITFHQHSHAELALAKLHRYPLNSMLMSIEWQEPKENLPGGLGAERSYPPRSYTGTHADTAGAHVFSSKGSS